MISSPVTVDGYVMGSLGFDVATSGIFENWLENPKTVEPYKSKVSQFRINIHTLVRNVAGAIEEEVRSKDFVMEKTMDSLELIEDAIRDVFPSVEIVYYITELAYYRRLIPRSEIRVSRSEKIRNLTQMEHEITGDVYKALEELGRTVDRVDNKKGNIAKTVMMLTHLPADLLCYRYYSDLYLVESHTGNIRERTTFSSKILPSHRRHNAHFIPFNHMSFQVYGDGGKMLHQASGAVTTAYTNLAQEMKWNYMTSADKIVSDVNRTRNEKLIDWFSR